MTKLYCIKYGSELDRDGTCPICKFLGGFSV